MKKIDLFLLPFAGGNVASFRMFRGVESPQIRLNFIELPGRGARVKERLLDDIHEMADDVFSRILEKAPNNQYAIFGHSMGALLAYLISRKIAHSNMAQPLYLFLSGCAVPSRIRLREKIHHLSREKFIMAITQLEGSPKEILEDHLAMDFFEPILRSDFKAIETYVFEKGGKKIRVPIDVFIGDSENITREDAHAWDEVTDGKVSLTVLPGKHFFIYDHYALIMDHIERRLCAFFNSV